MSRIASTSSSGIEFDMYSIVTSCHSIFSRKLKYTERAMAHDILDKTFGPNVKKTVIVEHPKRVMCKITFATPAECAEYLRNGPRFIDVTLDVEISIAAYAHNAVIRAREQGLVVVVNGNHYGMPSACLYKALSVYGKVWNIVRNRSNNTMVLMSNKEGVASVLDKCKQLCVAYAGVTYSFALRPFYNKIEEATKTQPNEQGEEDYQCQLCSNRAEYICIQPYEEDARVHFTLCVACRKVLGEDYCLTCSLRGKECTAMSTRVDWSSLQMLTH